ncbi:uncharacterized protein DUF3576 [Albidovulum inexpectatum]|uniref:Uncharacterized protein DUF3576 n=1 Tax=Albidovulum inexpectatum TaxID=196587 RepID=A0A2S5JDW7_9RHOB|nr:DUF3576 domain-containing protein [Albidovulum inexpectatum]PPB79687.1 uncharacterized protein DUF3576 [Albidovulum inexpectatum]
MTIRDLMRGATLLATIASLAACGGFTSGDSSPFGGGNRSQTAQQQADEPRRSTIWDLFSNTGDPNVTVAANRYLWRASLEVLDFLPIESVDPFTGVIVTGYGTPPGGGRAYRATVYVTDPALDARSLKVALMTRSGPADPATQRAVEDAILTRARQLRIRDGKL